MSRAKRGFRVPVQIWMLVAALLAFYLFFYGVFRWAAMSDIGDRALFTTIDGREVALVSYSFEGPRGVLDLGGFGGSSERERVVAIDTHSHEVLWDTKVSGAFIGAPPRLLVADEHYAYAATDTGLAVLEVASGEVHTEAGSLPGIGAHGTEDRWAYDHDPETDAVLALLDDGSMVAVPVGETAAEPASPEQVDRWQVTLTESHRSLADDIPDLHSEGATSPSGIHLQAVSSPDNYRLDTLLFHDGPSDHDCYSPPCYFDGEGTFVEVSDTSLWSLR